MAPVPETISTSLTSLLSFAKRSGSSIKLLAVRSLADTLDNTLTSTLSTLSNRQKNEASNSLHKRQDDNPNSNWRPGEGIVPPTSVPTNAIFAIFGIIGAGFVITAIWFFMIAPNGGFVFREGDWEDYKSTVLRRKGPNGTTLSGATESTMLGGGSVVGRRERKRYRDKLGSSDASSEAWTKTESTLDSETVVSSEMDAMTSITRGVSGGYRREKVAQSNKAIKKEEERLLKEERRREKEEARRQKKRGKGKGYDEESSVGFEESVYDEPVEAIRSYRHEQPARVGGMNREADGSGFETSTYVSSEATESLIGGQQMDPRSSPKKERTRRYKDSVYSEVMIESPSPTKKRDGPGIRKVDTVYEQDRLAKEARRLRDKGRAEAANRAAGSSSDLPKRNFSFAPGDDVSAVSSEEARNERNERRERRRRERAERDQRNIPGTFAEESEISGVTASTDTTGTKSYHHPIPGLSSAPAGDSYAEERRRRRQEGANYKR